MACLIRNLMSKAVFMTLIFIPIITFAGIDTDDEAVNRLDLQGQIDNFAPLSKTFWAGSHNGYSAKEWNGDGNYIYQINQYYKPLELFKRGIRLTEYDTYPVSWFSSNPELCHLGLEEDTVCLVFGPGDYASLGDGFDEIESFIKDKENRDEVLLIKFEVYDSDHHTNFRNKVGEKIDDRLGDIVFKPSDWGYAEGDCASLPVQKLTKADVLAAGKNIIMFTQVPRDFNEDEEAGKNLCDYHTSGSSYKDMLDYIWIGVDEMDYQGNLYPNQPIAQNSSQHSADSSGNVSTSSDATTDYENGNFSVRLDSSTSVLTWLDWLVDTDEDIKVSGEDVIEAAELGFNMLELSRIEYDSVSDAPLIKDFVWSWDKDYPQGSNACALSTTGGAVQDASCSADRVHACVDESRNWYLTDTAGEWQEGFAQCAALGYQFAMPYNPYENAALAKVKTEAQVSASVWLNYYEAIGDFWLAGSESQQDYGYVKKAAIGSDSNDDFDSIDMIKRKLLSAGGMNLSSVQIRSGNRIDGFKVCYENTQGVSMATVGETEFCRTYGGDGGSWGNTLSFDSSNGEYLSDVKICIDDAKYGYDTVYYLKFTSSTGSSINGGNSTSDCTTYASTSSQQVFAFHGNTNTELESLGIHKISNTLIDSGYFSTAWLNRNAANDSDDDENESFNKHQQEGSIASNCTAEDVSGYLARRASDKLDVSLTRDIISYDEASGFACWHDDNGQDGCDDYEVKYFFKNASCVL